MAKNIPSIHPVIPHKPIQVDSALFPDRIPGWPSLPFGFVEAVAVIDETGFTVGGFGGEAVGVRLGEGAGGAGGFAEGAVFVLGADGLGGGVDHCNDVAVRIVAGVVAAQLGIRYDEQRTYAAGVLAGVAVLGGDIETPCENILSVPLNVKSHYTGMVIFCLSL